MPGTTFTLTGTANRGGGGNAHQVVFTVTELTKMVNGVRTVVLWDRDIQEGVLVEEELAFWAQDDSGNVWLMGEYPEEHEGNKVSAPSTWLAGNQGSAPGILMRADPKLNTSQYEQGDAPSVEFLDLAKVFAVDQQHLRAGRHVRRRPGHRRVGPEQPAAGRAPVQVPRSRRRHRPGRRPGAATSRRRWWPPSTAS